MFHPADTIFFSMACGIAFGDGRVRSISSSYSISSHCNRNSTSIPVATARLAPFDAIGEIGLREGAE